MSKLDPQRLIFGAFLLIPIVAAEWASGHFALPAWPAFLVMIMFFMEHMDIKKAPHILVGGACGIASLILAKVLVTALAPSLGVEGATILFVVLVVYSIVALGELVPMVFNNYAFMFLTVSVVASKAGDPKPLQWIAIELLGGAAMLASIVVIGKVMAARATPQDPTQQAYHQAP